MGLNALHFSSKHAKITGYLANLREIIFLGDFMNHRTKLLALACMGSFAALSSAQISITGGGPFNSVAGPGDPGNFSTNVINTAASSIYGNFSFSGTLNSAISGTWIQDSEWAVANTNFGSGFFFAGVGQGNYSTANINLSANGLFWVNNGDNLFFEASENFDDGAGADANWTNVAFNWSGAPTITNIGTYATGTSFIFDTEGSNFDTEIALFTSTGQFLGSDDDGGTGLLSLLNSGVLADGTYYFVASSFGGGYDNGLAFAGTESGNLLAQVNGVNVFTGAHAANTVHAFSFVVPEPASFAVLGIGALALIRRRRNKS